MSHPGKAVRLTATVVGLVYALALHLSGLTLDSNAKHALAYLPTVRAAWGIRLPTRPSEHPDVDAAMAHNRF